jgi:hypothetical protein
MNLHERTMRVSEAELELSQWLSDWSEAHELTFGEWVKILSGQLAGRAKYVIRAERHPDDPERGGDDP